MYVASSVSSLFNYEHENISREGVMKRYALLFDNVIFNRHGCSIGPGQVAQNLAECISMLIHEADTLQERKKLGKNKEFAKIFVDCWDFVVDVQKFESKVPWALDQNVRERLGEFCHAEIRRTNGLPHDSFKYDIDDVRVLNGDLFADLGIHKLLLEEGIDLIPSYSPLVGRALQSEYLHNNIECHDLFSNDILVPDFDALSWGEVIDLRNDKYLKAFREVIFELASTNKDLDSSLVTKVQSDLWNLVSDSKPNLAKTFLTGIIGNLPSPIILNPIGIGAVLKDTYDAKQLEEKYGHVFFMHKLRSVKS
jgi:hypothetical protein